MAYKSQQEIFDTIVTHLRKQGVRAVDPETGKCCYRTSDEYGRILKCAVGCLIPDDKYTLNIEGAGVGKPVVLACLPPDINHNRLEVLDLLRKMQKLHDLSMKDTSEMEWGFKQVAKTFGLVYTEPTN